MDGIIIALILGIIEGITEFLPISSTGHLIIATDLLHQNQNDLASFNIIIQFGAILAVVYLYWDRFIDFFNVKNILQLKNNIHLKKLNIIHIALATIPVLLIGFFARKAIKAHLYNASFVTFTLIIIGIAIIIIEKIKPKPLIHRLDDISYKDAFLIGLGQCAALLPGVSRSGATMLTAMNRKIDTQTAADFSFLISVPVIAAATGYELLKSWHEFHTEQIITLAIGLFTSFIVAVIAIKTFLKILKRLGLIPFAYYRIIFGIVYYLIVIRGP